MKKISPSKKQNGFTLVELSIVLVIIGLIIAGILGGEQLIKGAKASRAISDASKHMASLNAFKIKYGDLPGDMPNAWLTFTTIPADLQVNSCDAGTCGYAAKAGDGFITAGTESAMVFPQMSMAGILPTGAYTPSATSMPEAMAARCNVNMPKGPYPGSCWQLGDRFFSSLPIIGTNNTTSAHTNWLTLAGEYEEPLFFGPALLGGAVMTVDDATAIDLKADDGRPGTGDIVAGNSEIFGMNLEAEAPLCVDFSDAMGCAGDECLTYPDTAAAYNVGERTPVCVMGFQYR